MDPSDGFEPPLTGMYYTECMPSGGNNNECAICGLPPKWNNKPLVLHLDHINGERKDNRIENFRLLCPNCHAQTETFSWKNYRRKMDPLLGIEPRS